MTIEQLKDLLRKHKLRPNKTFGQNFLLDDFVLQDMVDASGVTGEEAVLEVGPGIATLTGRLLDRAKYVLAVEKDPKFQPLLHALKKGRKNFRYEIDDILSFNFQAALKDFPRYRVVANIPYYITGKIVQLFVRAEHKPQSITLLVQKEVARNISAEPGKLNLLAISVQLYGTPHFVQMVPARSFYPAPKVDSAIVHIDLSNAASRYDIPDEKKLFRILRACFAGKRKQIHNTLVNNLHLEKDTVDAVLKKIDVSPQSRPQELTIEQWLKLASAVDV
jgi:16S rRNA (adenine1518-N6/adenine1519-N6)-dimethyltransferase